MKMNPSSSTKNNKSNSSSISINNTNDDNIFEVTESKISHKFIKIIGDQSLFKDDKVYFTQEEKDYIRNSILPNINDEQRRKFWLIESGAKREMINNPGYYSNLTENYPEYIPSPYSFQIELDLNRTFPEDEYFREKANLEKLNNVLIAYSRRNISIGYCQGFNFIVGRLLQLYDSEEEAFWIFTQILEEYLPVDYFCQIKGVMIDLDIILPILRKNFNMLFNEKDFTDIEEHILRNFISQLMISLFSTFSIDKYYLLWDALIFQGNIFIFKAIIIIFQFLMNSYKKEFKLSSFNNFMKKFQYKMETFNEFINEKQRLFSNVCDLDIVKIDKIRIIAHENKETDTTHNKDITKSKAYRKNSLIAKNECDIDWPICLMDISYRIDHTYYFVYKNIDLPIIIDDFYFAGCGNDFKPMNRNYFKNKGNEKLVSTIRSFENILIERHKHCCDVTHTTRKAILAKASAEAIEEVKIDNEIRRSRQSSILMNKNLHLLKKSTNLFDDYYKDKVFQESHKPNNKVFTMILESNIE